MRDVLDRLDTLGLRWYITGSEAAACYGVLRQTFDTDIVLDLAPGRFRDIAAAFEADHAVADEIPYGDFSMASVINRATSEKTDLIVRRSSPWTEATMVRRAVKIDHPTFGPSWVSALEDLILAKLIWSEGTSELQLRDCAILMRVNRDRLDDAYLEGWATRLGVERLLSEVRRAP